MVLSVLLISMIVFLLIAFYVILLIIIIDMAMHYKDWKEYEQVYKDLSHLRFYRSWDLVYGYNAFDMMFLSQKTHCFIWFVDDDSFLVNRDSCYIHNHSLLFSPIQYYWRKKYSKWFKDHINIDKLESLHQ